MTTSSDLRKSTELLEDSLSQTAASGHDAPGEIAATDEHLSPQEDTSGLFSYLEARYPDADLTPTRAATEYLSLLGGKPTASSDVAADPTASELVNRVVHLSASRPATDTPVVSIIVPVYDQLIRTLVCLFSVLANPTAVSYEVLVADDMSGDGTEAALKQMGGAVRYIRNEDNLGFLRSCNSAARQARGEYILLLNNDTLVLPGAIDALVELARARPDAGMVGSKLLYPDGTLQEAGGIIWNDATAWNYGRYRHPGLREYNYVREVDYISGAAILIPRKVWVELGGFDELFVPAYCEDSDFAFRLRRHGWKVLYQPLSEVVHYEGSSHGSGAGSAARNYQEWNIFRLKARWREVLDREHLPVGTRVIRARDRALARPILLVIDESVPDPGAGSRTVFAFMRTFLGLGWVVKLRPAGGSYDPLHGPKLEQMGIELLCDLSDAQFREWLQAYGAEIDFVLASRPEVAAEHLGDVRCLTNAHIVYYGHGLEPPAAAADSSGAPSPGSASEAGQKAAPAEGGGAAAIDGWSA